MKQKNLKSILSWERITGFGLFEVILKLPILLYNAHILANKIIQIEPKLIITVDTKGFNFYLIQIIRKKIRITDLSTRVKNPDLFSICRLSLLALT